MTRFPRRHLLALALTSALANVPVWAQTVETAPTGGDATAAPAPLPPAPAQPAVTTSPDAFTVSDIRVDGLQRISAGTVFTYLPIERGDSVDASRAAEAIRALYKTGFFEDVRIDRQGSILVVTVVERPAINKLTLVGNKDIKTEDLLKGLTEIGLAEGETFNRLSLDQVTQELNRQYNNRGKYNAQITPSVTRLDRNRVDVTINVVEGKAAKIRHINLVGNEKFEEEAILESWESGKSNWLSWYKRDDQYSREKLAGDLEKLNEFYLDRGYVDFSLDSAQVSISPDKRDMFITAGLSEGEQYTVSSVKVTGDTVLPQEEVEKMAFIREGQIFSRRLLELTSDSIIAVLSNIGYAFAQVNPVPTIDREKRTVAVEMQVVPGPRVNVRRIVFKGNTRTTDEVLRREMRQFEGAWYSQAAIDRSKVRLQRLGYFETVEVETIAVPGSDDKVDIAFTVKETTSGSFVFGVGYSQLSGLSTTVQLTQRNFLGSGNQVSIEAQRNSYLERYSFSFLNPYFTDEGLSLGYNLWWREFDNSDFNAASFSSTSGAAQAILGLPITETDVVTALVGIDSNQINTFPGSTPPSIINYINALGVRTFHAARTELSWASDSRNDFFAPTRGTYQRISTEFTLPGSTVEYYKLNYEYSRYWPISRKFVVNTRVELGYGDSFGDAVSRVVDFPDGPDADTLPDPTTIIADGLPFFENFYAGGPRSVRGFVDNTLGPRQAPFPGGYAQPLGGSVLTTGSVEVSFPTLFDTPAARVSAFLDFGNVYTDLDSFDAGNLRASVGAALIWRSPMGPVAISYAFPIKKEDGDEIERLQFTFGGAF